MRSPVLKITIVSFSGLLLMAADPAWKTKPAAQWSEAEAKQILTQSPWVGKAKPGLLPQVSEARRREGGQMGGGVGVGVEGLSTASFIGGGSKSPTHGPRPTLTPTLEIRWESAAPVRAAEVKTNAEDAPQLDAGFYAIALYDIPGLDPDQRTLPNELKKDAYLKVEGRKDRKAARVDVLAQGNGLATVIYMFPRTDEITVADKRITFTALIGRLSLAQYFYTEEMQVQGKLEL